MSENSRRRRSRTEWFLVFLGIPLAVFNSVMLLVSGYHAERQDQFIHCLHAILLFITVAWSIRVIFEYRRDKREQRASNPPPP